MSVKQKAKPRIYTLFLYTGYVESGSNSCLVAHYPKGFDTLEAALKDLATGVIEPCLEVTRATKCTHQVDPKDKFCRECGVRKDVGRELPERDEIVRWFLDFFGGDTRPVAKYAFVTKLEDFKRKF